MKSLTGIITVDFYDELTYSALLSLLKVCDEIILIEDVNSVGKISEEFKGKVELIKLKKKLNHSERRNEGLRYSQSQWNIILDSDEVLSETLSREIPKLLLEKNLDGYWFSRRNYLSSGKYLKYGLFYPDYQLRLFKNKEEYHFFGVIHPHININYEKTKEVNLDILHYQRHQKYSSFANYKNFLSYIEAESEILLVNKEHPIILFLKGIMQGTMVFFNGFFRGKGFLDGWDGFRAHILFTLYIFLPYIIASRRKFFT